VKKKSFLFKSLFYQKLELFALIFKSERKDTPIFEKEKFLERKLKGSL